MLDEKANTIEVTVDKSHLITIGERLYGESIELIRELVNNAYDADATEVKITIIDDRIIVEDDGEGMDMDGLRQYFNIGSPEKRIHRKSLKFGRDRIGEFGIGKFATLSACPHFEVWTKKSNFQAIVIFDKDEWERSGDRWHLPLQVETPDLNKPDGTRVTLLGVRKRFNLQEVEKRIIETVPIKAANFSVYLNGRKIAARYVPGRRIPFLEGTDYGVIHGEIVITSQSISDMCEAGIECKVRQVTIKREFFGMEEWKEDVARIRGEVHADFLPITSDRTDFIKDRPEYEAFRTTMDGVMERVKKALEEVSDYRENRRAKRVLTEVIEKVKEALVLNPDYCPEGLIPIAEEPSASGQPGYISEKEGKEKEGEKKEVKATKSSRKRRKPVQVKRLTPTAVVKRLAVGRGGISCCIDHFGPEGPECITEGTVVYINRDHPLHQSQMKKRDAYRLYIARLLTQEISLMKDPRNPRQAYERQSKLLKDALAE